MNQTPAAINPDTFSEQVSLCSVTVETGGSQLTGNQTPAVCSDSRPRTLKVAALNYTKVNWRGGNGIPKWGHRVNRRVQGD